MLQRDGNRQWCCLHDADRRRCLHCLHEALSRCDGRLHAPVPMGTHAHPLPTSGSVGAVSDELVAWIRTDVQPQTELRWDRFRARVTQRTGRLAEVRACGRPPAKRKCP